MKRIIAVILAALMSVAVLAACDSSETKSSSSAPASSAVSGNNAATVVDLNAVLDKINAETGLSMDKVEDVSRLKRYYQLDEADIKQFACERDGETEIVMIEATSGEAADRIEAVLQSKLDALINNATSYSQEKLAVIQACKVTKDGNFVSMIVSDNAPAALKIYQDSIK